MNKKPKEFTEKSIDLMTVPFSCDGCKKMMYRNEWRTNVSTGIRYTMPNGKKSWRSVDINFFCEKCEPIKREDKEKHEKKVAQADGQIVKVATITASNA